MRLLFISLMFTQSCFGKEVTLATILEDGFFDKDEKSLVGNIEMDKKWLGKDLGLCFWIYPFRFLNINNAILSFNRNIDDDADISVRATDQKLFFKYMKCVLNLDDRLLRREWSHFCFSVKDKVIETYFNGTQIPLTPECEAIADMDGPWRTFSVRVGSDFREATPFSGCLADVRLYWRSLSANEVKNIANLSSLKNDSIDVIKTLNEKPMSKSDDPKTPETPFNSQSDEDDSDEDDSDEDDSDEEKEDLKQIESVKLISKRSPNENPPQNEVPSFVEVSTIDGNILLEPYMPYLLMYIDERNNYKTAERVCSIRNASLPSFILHGKETLVKLINNFTAKADVPISTFWKNPDNSSGCITGTISSSGNDIIEDFEICDNSGISYFCVIEKSKFFYFFGVNDINYKMYPVPYEIGAFETTGPEKIELLEKSLYLKNILKNDKSFIANGVKTDNLIGRRKWHESENKSSIFPMTLTKCSDNEFTCADGDCSNINSVCDLGGNCPDQSDENILFCQVSIPPDEQYDKRLAPKINATEAEKLVLRFTILRISEINLDDNIIQMFVSCEVDWRDPRLKFKFLRENENNVIFTENSFSYWQPHIVINGAINADEEVLSFQKNIGRMTAKPLDNGTIQKIDANTAKVFEGKDVLLTSDISTSLILKCDMVLFYYPFDIQNCSFSLRIEEEFRTGLMWNKIQSNVSMNTNIFLSLYKVDNFTPSFTSDTEIEMTLVVSRKYGAYVFNTILPCVVLEIIGFATHLLPLHDYGDRVNVTLACLIVIAALFTTTSENLPESAEPKLIDIWIFAHVVLLLIVYLSHLLVIYVHDRETEEEEYTKKADGKEDDKILQKWMRNRTALDYQRVSSSRKRMITPAWNDDFEYSQNSKRKTEMLRCFSSSKWNKVTFVMNILLYCAFLLFFFFTAAKYLQGILKAT